MNLPKPQIDRETAMQLWILERSGYAKEQVVLNNTGLVKIILKSLNLDPLDDDLFMTGMLGVVKAVNTFDPGKRFTFSAYAVPVIRNEILKTLRKQQIIPAFSLDEPCSPEEDAPTYADIIADGRCFEEGILAKAQFSEVMELFTDREKQVVSLRLDGKTQEETAILCGITQPQVCRRLETARRKYRRAFS